MRAAFGIAFIAASLGACSLLTSVDDLRGDAGTDASPVDAPQAIDAPAGGCTVQIAPSLITVAPGAGTTATVTIARGVGLTGNAVITFDAVPSITSSSITIASTDVTGPAAFTAAASAQAAAVDINVLATIGTTECKTVATIAISGVLATFPKGTATTFTVPKTTYLTKLSFDVWGGGGGGGGLVTSQATPGKGGAGGLSYALIDVVSNETLTIITGTGGGGSSSNNGGGGGGCSEVLRGSTALIIGAGGGGGGASENENGGPGGGAGQPGGSTSMGAGGTAGQLTAAGLGGSGGADGSPTQGGAAKQGTVAGGAPGGGKGGSGLGGGGGGCGVFGGGGGGPDPSVLNFAASGGGGGAGMITSDAGAVLNAKATTPPDDPRFPADSGVNVAGAAAIGGTLAPGGPGHVIISIP